MRDFAKMFGLYLAALWERWFPLMSCAIFTAIGVYSAAANKGNHWIVVASGVAAVILFLWASYGAWHQEHIARVAAEKLLKELTKPDLSTYVRKIWAAPSGDPQDSIVTAIVEVTNNGAPTALKDYTAEILANGKHVVAELVPPPNLLTLTDEAGNSQGLQLEDYFLRKGAVPIPLNGFIQGFVILLAKGISRSDMANNARVNIAFKDVATGQSHLAEGDFGGSGHGNVDLSRLQPQQASKKNWELP